MYINKIYVDQVAFARSLTASVTTRRDVLARLPQRPLDRKGSTSRNRLLRFMRKLQSRAPLDRGVIETQLKTKYRQCARPPAVSRWRLRCTHAAAAPVPVTHFTLCSPKIAVVMRVLLVGQMLP
ncbi:MAG: hypothetical protein JWN85_3837 [Gammaproteobacteria bacterium]|nr:hypothetical protein [Gammaproteobacteria bacterium]